MNPVLFTIFEDHYHHGVVALINSAIRSGFTGPICLFHRGDIPDWALPLKKNGPASYEVEGLELHFLDIEVDYYPAYYKPFAALRALALFPQCDSVVYADPDVTLLAPWPFIEDWISHGVAYCLDANFPYLPAHHPWRVKWRLLHRAALARDAGESATYPNSGFLSVRRQDASFLEDWAAITRQFAIEGGNKQKVRLQNRHLPVVGDQDLMAATLMGWQGEQSVLGPDGMGFTGHFVWLSHDIGQPKPWLRPFLRQALQGFPPGQAARYFLEFSGGPLRSLSPGELQMMWLRFRTAQLISRIWDR